jgi:aryl-alcohol dehydrogenase-like predicted oxidoreductase
MQNRYNLVNREDEREMIPLCLDQGVGIIPYSPLARGLLAGTRERDGNRHTARASADDHQYRPADFLVVDAVRAVAAELSRPPAQIALAWLLGKPAVSAAIIGATKPGHIADALPAPGIVIDDDTTARLEAPYLPHWIGQHT